MKVRLITVTISLALCMNGLASETHDAKGWHGVGRDGNGEVTVSDDHVQFTVRTNATLGDTRMYQYLEGNSGSVTATVHPFKQSAFAGLESVSVSESHAAPVRFGFREGQLIIEQGDDVQILGTRSNPVTLSLSYADGWIAGYEWTGQWQQRGVTMQATGSPFEIGIGVRDAGETFVTAVFESIRWVGTTPVFNEPAMEHFNTPVNIDNFDSYHDQDSLRERWQDGPGFKDWPGNGSRSALGLTDEGFSQTQGGIIWSFLDGPPPYGELTLRHSLDLSQYEQIAFQTRGDEPPSRIHQGEHADVNDRFLEITAMGDGLDGTADEFRFFYRKFKGDGELSACLLELRSPGGGRVWMLPPNSA